MIRNSLYLCLMNKKNRKRFGFILLSFKTKNNHRKRIAIYVSFVNSLIGYKKNTANNWISIICGVFGGGDRTRTCDLWVMSPTSYQLLHSAISRRKGKALLLEIKMFFRIK